MKSGIHPEYHLVTVTCACGETFVARSTNKEMRLEICSKCHPFFTGKQKLIDSAGRVERFERRYKGVVPKAPPAKKAVPPAPPKASAKSKAAGAKAEGAKAASSAGAKSGTPTRPAGSGTGDPAGSSQA